MGHHLAGRLVVGQHASGRRRDSQAHRLAVHAHLIADGDALADMGCLAIDGDAAIDDQLFHVAARADAGLREHLVQLRRVRVRGQNATFGRGFGRLFFDRLAVVLARHHVGETVAGVHRLERLRLGHRVERLQWHDRLAVLAHQHGCFDRDAGCRLGARFARPALAAAAVSIPPAACAVATFGLFARGIGLAPGSVAFDRRGRRGRAWRVALRPWI